MVLQYEVVEETLEHKVRLIFHLQFWNKIDMILFPWELGHS